MITLVCDGCDKSFCPTVNPAPGSVTEVSSTGDSVCIGRNVVRASSGLIQAGGTAIGTGELCEECRRTLCEASVHKEETVFRDVVRDLLSKAKRASS